MSRPSFHPQCLVGRVALITGGGTGIGKGIARVFLAHGAKVAIVSRNINTLKATAEELQRETGGVCLPVRADIRSQSDVEAAVDHVLSVFSRIDILVNNAAGNFLVPLEKLSLKGFKAVMETDAMGVFMVSKVVFHKAFQGALKCDAKRILKRAEIGTEIKEHEAALVRAASQGKTIINISMTLHYTGALLQTHAGAAKAAIDALTKHMAVEWGPYNIRVNAIAPGPIAETRGLDKINPFTSRTTTTSRERSKTPVVSDSNKAIENDTKEQLEMLRRFVPMQRLGHVQDIGFSCLFLALPEASYITGATLVVDGGQWLTSGNFTVLEPTVNEKWRSAPFAANL